MKRMININKSENYYHCRNVHDSNLLKNMLVNIRGITTCDGGGVNVQIRRKKIKKSNYIYIFFNKKNIPLYIGRTCKPESRIKAHQWSSVFFNLSKKVRIYKINNSFDINEIEHTLIKKYRPQYNKTLPLGGYWSE